VVFNGEIVHFHDDVRQQFPDDQDLVDLDVSSYLAVPMVVENRKVIGHIAVMDDQPISKNERTVNLLKAFAIRGAMELEKQHAFSTIDSLRSRYQLPIGGDFFQNLAKSIAVELEVDFAIFGRFEQFPDQKVKTITIYHDGNFLDLLSYDLIHSPCETVIN
jgi:GAF domain-containing protein